MSRLGGDTVTVVSELPVLDDAGHPVVDDLGIAVTAEHRVLYEKRCSWEYTGGTETNSNVNPSEIDGRVFMPPDAVVTESDRIEYRGLSHAVQTPPRLWTDELGRPDYLHVVVRYSKG